MSDILEGMGTAAEGGLFARALDPGSGAKQRHEGDPDNCLNCGTALTGGYCHACGQSSHIHRTIGAFMHDLLHGALHFEGKLWHTLPMLALRPGQLTRRYIDGERARFVSPMALFLFSVFLMFATFQIIGASGHDSTPEVPTVEVVRPDDGEAASVAVEGIDPAATTQEALTDAAHRVEEALAEQARQQQEEAAANADDTTGAPPVVPDLTGWKTGIDALDDGILKKWRDNPDLMLYKLQANAYKFSWLLIPLSVPFVWVLFAWRRRFNSYDHAIFVTYSLSFMTLLFVTLSILEAIGVNWALLTLVATVVPPVHMYKQLRRGYDLSRFSAFWRLMVLSLFIWIVVTLFIQLLLMIGGM